MADNQYEIQNYLQKFNISSLFEELMSNMINDRPNDPVLYLSKILKKKSEKDKGHHSVDEIADEIIKERAYAKPWLSNTKTNKATKQTDPNQSGSQRQARSMDWDNKTNMPAATFDELFEITQQQKPSGKTVSFPVKLTSTGVNMTESQQAGNSTKLLNSGIPTPIAVSETANEILAAELITTKPRIKPEDVKTVSSGSPIKSKLSSHKAMEQKRKENLQKIVLQEKNVSGSQTRIAGESNIEPDTAMELFENAVDLINEGVTKVKQQGGIKQSYRASQPRSRFNEAIVKVSMCARCAKVIADVQSSEEPRDLSKSVTYGPTTIQPSPSQEKPSIPYGQMSTPQVNRPATQFTYSDDSDRENTKPPATTNQPLSSRSHYSLFDTDEEIESVSQVSGPRKPTWPEDSDKNATAKKQRGEVKKPSNKGSSDKTNTSTTTTAKTSYCQAWPVQDIGFTTADDDDEVAQAPKGGGWAQTDYDTDSSYYGTPSHPFTTDKRTY